MDITTQGGRASGVRGKRLRVEVLLAGTTGPEPLPVESLVEADLWSQLPADVPRLLALLPRADLYLQDEVQFAFHPTLTRLWSLRGRRSQRLIEAPGDNRKVYGFGLVDWRDGWFDGRIAPGRTADGISRAGAGGGGTLEAAGTRGHRHRRQSQNAHVAGIPAGAQHGDGTCRSTLSGVHASL